MSLKLIVVGDSGVGKTSIINRLMHNEFRETYIPTIGVDLMVLKKTTELGEIKVMIWDTAGQERFNSIVSSYFRGSDGVLLCFSLNDKESFDNLNRWLDMVKSNCQSNINVILVGTKSDLTNKVENEDILAYSYKNDLDYRICSSKLDSSEKIETIVEALISSCLKNKKLVGGDGVSKIVESNSKTSNKIKKSRCCTG